MLTHTGQVFSWTHQDQFIKDVNSKIDELNGQKETETKKELEFSDKIDELNQETDSLLEEIDKWQM